MIHGHYAPLQKSPIATNDAESSTQGATNRSLLQRTYSDGSRCHCVFKIFACSTRNVGMHIMTDAPEGNRQAACGIRTTVVPCRGKYAQGDTPPGTYRMLPRVTRHILSPGKPHRRVKSAEDASGTIYSRRRRADPKGRVSPTCQDKAE